MFAAWPSAPTARTGYANVLVPAGTVGATYWIESKSLGSSSSFSTRIAWRLLDAATCAVLSADEAVTASAISPENCGKAV